MSHRLHNVILLRRLGINVLIFDYRGYVKSERKRPDERGTYLDALAAFEELQLRCGGTQTCIFGRSLGGAVALELARRMPPDRLILESTFTSLPTLAKAFFPYLPIKLLVRTKYDNLSKMKDIHCPVLIIHGVEDELVPFEHGRLLFEGANEPKLFFPVPGGMHNDTYLKAGRRYEKAITSFLSL